MERREKVRTAEKIRQALHTWKPGETLRLSGTEYQVVASDKGLAKGLALVPCKPS